MKNLGNWSLGEGWPGACKTKTELDVDEIQEI